MQAPEYDYLFKLVITGDSNSGKSRVVERYTKNSFSANCEITIGVEFTTKVVTLSNGEKVKL